jgi:hypothetical protein
MAIPKVTSDMLPKGTLDNHINKTNATQTNTVQNKTPMTRANVGNKGIKIDTRA